MNNLDFLNLNSLRSFPIRENLTRISTDGLFQIPDNFMVDLTLSLGGSVEERYYIGKITNRSDYIEVWVYDEDNSDVGVFTVPIDGFLPNKDVYLVASDSYPGAVGRLTVFSLDGMTEAAAGTFSFTLATAELEMRTVVPAFTGVSRVQLTDGTRTFNYTGNVTMTFGSNLRIREGTGIIIDAGEGLGLNKECNDTGVAIKSINGVVPDSDGAFTLVPSECAVFEAIEFGLLFKDGCSQPCQGCEELEQLTARSIATEADILVIRNVVDNLQQQLTQLTTLVNYTYDCQN